MRSSTVLVLIAAIVLTGCSAKPVIFPQADIVYQAIDSYDYGETTNMAIGFINADSSNDVTIKIEKRPSRPVFSKELEGVIFLEAKDPIHIFGGVGKIVLLHESGKYTICDKLLDGGSDYSFSIQGTRTLLVNSVYRLEIVDIDTCEVVKTLISFNSENGFQLINSAHVSSSGKKVVFAVDWGQRGMANMARILVLDVQTGEIQEMQFAGGNPTLSPDDEQIAYVGVNGINVSDISKQRNRLLVPINSELVDLGERSPYPFWSPDGKWLVYHKCINKSCDYLRDYAIFKVNVNTGEETKIKDGGMFPVWIN